MLRDGSLARYAYGKNRTERDFAGQDFDTLFLDTPMTKGEQLFELLYGGPEDSNAGVRLDPGDVILVYHERDLSRGRGLQKIREHLAKKGVTIEAFGPSNGQKKAQEGTRGIPYEAAVEAQKYWHAPGIGIDFINAQLAKKGFGPYARHQFIYALGNKGDEPRTLTPPTETTEEEGE